MNCTLQYPKKTPHEVREEMDRIEHDSKPLTSCQINGIDWEKRLSNRKKRRERDMKQKEADMVKKAKLARRYFTLAKAASYIMVKRAGTGTTTSTKDIIKQMQDQVANSYIDSLKKERDRTVKDDLLRGALSGGLNGAQYGMLSGLLFGTTVAPAKDLVRGSDRTVLQSFGRGAGLGGLSGMGAGALIGSAVGALNNWATRERRRENAIAKLKELGITD